MVNVVGRIAVVKVEIARLFRAALVSLRSGRRPWLACVAWILAVAATLADRGSTRHLLLSGGGVRANLPLWQEIIRLPVSAFVPTPELPLIGAVAQLLIVFSLGEVLLGRRATLLVAALGQLVSSLAARVMILAGTAAMVGLPASQAAVLDTGPSGMTTAVGAWLLVRTRCYGCLTVLGLAIGSLAVAQDNLDGREHFVAYIVGVLTAAALPLVRALAALLRRYWHLLSAGISRAPHYGGF